MYVCKVITSLLNSKDSLQEQQIAAHVYGKECRTPSPGECRAILPLTVFLTLCDIIISTRVHAWTRSVFIVPESFYIGGGRGTQCLEAQLVIEKSLDARSCGAISSCDIRRYYDSICVLTVARFMLARGCDPALCVAVLCHQI